MIGFLGEATGLAGGFRIDQVRHQEKLNQARRQGQHDRLGWEDLGGPWEFLRPPGFFWAEPEAAGTGRDGGAVWDRAPRRAGDRAGAEYQVAWRPQLPAIGPGWPRLCLPGLGPSADLDDPSAYPGLHPKPTLTWPGSPEELPLLDRRRTLYANLRRRACAGAPTLGDLQWWDRRRRWLPFPYREEARPVVILLRDISASMQNQPGGWDREFFWTLVRFLEWRYPGCELVFLVHQVDCREVTQQEFFSLVSQGGTRYSPGYRAADSVCTHRYHGRWVYFFHVSDGDNLPSDYQAAGQAVGALGSKVRLFAYGELRQQAGLTAGGSRWMGYLGRLAATFSRYQGQQLRVVYLEPGTSPWNWLESFLDPE